jgi:methyl-accepting chemotaxis protein
MKRLQRLITGNPEKTEQPTGNPDAGNLEAVEAAMAPVPVYCEVVTAHLADVVDQTDAAARAIILQLGNVDALAEVMADDVGGLVKTLSRTEVELTQVSTSTNQLVYRLVNHFIERDRQVRRLVSEIRGVDRHISDIEDVIRQTNVIAFNTMIEAVKAGDAGAGFVQEIRKLADQSARAARSARDIGSSITALTSRMDALMADEQAFELAPMEIDLSAETTPMARRLTAIVQAQSELATMMSATLKQTVDAAQQVSRSSASVAANTTGAVGHIQFQDISRQMIEHASAAVRDVHDLAENIISYTTGTLAEPELQARHIDSDRLRRSHVMARQRSIHNTATGEDTHATNEPPIELF